MRLHRLLFKGLSWAGPKITRLSLRLAMREGGPITNLRSVEVMRWYYKE